MNATLKNATLKSAKLKVTRHIKFYLSLAISFLFVVAVEYWVTWESVLQLWKQVYWFWLLLAFVLVFLSYVIRSIRLYLYFYEDCRHAFLSVLVLMLQHNFYNNILPMRLGELSFPLLMKRHFKMNLASSAGALIWFRLLDLLTILQITLLSMGYLGILTGYIAILGAVSLFLLPLVLYLCKTRFYAWLVDSKETDRFNYSEKVSIKFFAVLKSFLLKVEPGLPKSQKHLWILWFCTQLNWAIKLMVFAWVLTLFVDIQWGISLLGVVGGEMTSILPVHGFAGMGTYEAGIVAALVPIGVPSETTLVAAVNLHLFLLVSTGLGMLISWALGHRAVNL